MNTDGLKKVLLEDQDGSFTGYSRTGMSLPSQSYDEMVSLLSQSEWMWDDATPNGKRYGLGDYRFPKAMLTGPSGNRKTVASLGITERGCIM